MARIDAIPTLFIVLLCYCGHQLFTLVLLFCVVVLLRTAVIHGGVTITAWLYSLMLPVLSLRHETGSMILVVHVRHADTC